MSGGTFRDTVDGGVIQWCSFHAGTTQVFQGIGLQGWASRPHDRKEPGGPLEYRLHGVSLLNAHQKMVRSATGCGNLAFEPTKGPLSFPYFGAALAVTANPCSALSSYC